MRHRVLFVVGLTALGAGCVEVQSREGGVGAGATRAFCGPALDRPCTSAPDDGDAPSTRVCWYRDDAPPGEGPMAEAFYRFETTLLGDAVRVALVFAEAFVDNTYGDRSSPGYRDGRRPHRFRDLVGSDHATLTLTDGDGERRVVLALDYLSASDDADSGYRSLGPWGGDGRVVSGDPRAVLTATSSMDDNLNLRGCRFFESSPSEAECPEWDPRVVYTTWVDVAIFGEAGFGEPALSSVHASPSRMDDTLDVRPGPCP
ncbi:MAG: hypothetical protein IT379_35925 [Deltaproteobacteria bacterium]|nr:hypothetical protein [Deltaproteobacteria bacterium]